MSLIDDLIKGTPYEKQVLRDKRKPLLVAFDKYKANVEYGIEQEDEAKHEQIVSWYRGLLDLNKQAIDNVPDCIKYYL